MIRTNISLTKELYDWVRTKAFSENKSIAKFIRDVLEEEKITVIAYYPEDTKVIRVTADDEKLVEY